MSFIASRASSIVWYIVTIVLLGLSWFVWSLPLNQYQAMGIHGGIDCDGPLSVFLFAIPSFIFCSIALLVFPYEKTVLACVLFFTLMFSGMICAITIAHTFQAQQAAMHQQSCPARL